MEHDVLQCDIKFVPKPRNGKSKYWCNFHDASATARFGGKMPRCEGAYRSIADKKRFVLNPDAYPGGVSLWGTVEPVYNSSGLPAERGIHVHARTEVGGKKKIDRTFDAVELVVPRDLFDDEKVVITQDTAIAYYLSRFLDRKVQPMFCTYCHAPHLDSDWFAVKPHRVHLCHNCNKLFRKDDRAISNPLEAVRHKKGDHDSRRRTKRPNKSLSLRQDQCPGGFQIWASNPALLWTSSRAEESGIHVHVYDVGKSLMLEDDTFDQVRIDGILLNENMLRHYMAQKALYYLKDKVVALKCPDCMAAKFDTGDAGFRPKKFHICDSCGSRFETPGKRKLVVSNPFVDTIRALDENRKVRKAKCT